MRTPQFDFIGRARRWAVISAVVVLAGLVAIVARGLDLSIEFTGGTAYTLVDVRDDVTAGELRDAARDAGADEVLAQLQLDGSDVVGAIVRMNALEPGGDTAAGVRDALVAASGASDVLEDFVGPTWGQRITAKALQALTVFLLVIVAYISFRLEFKMAIAAVVALVHDLAVTMGVYALVGFSVSPATVIALLTILGYSLYDTVVVFDRVRENQISLGDPGRRTIGELVNSSTNEVLMRSVNTSVTSILPVAALLVLGARAFGADTLQDLALALFVGMAAGIYSSLLVAGPVFVALKRREPAEQRRIAKAARLDRGLDEPDDAAPAGSPEARAPITTAYVRGSGSRAKRRRKRR